ncbi:hypothetical protein FHG87_018676 [Trinorchestia longiramus]|nr:hypothetical protein FHG87_018676 [Trinorchestia longiramus]
MHHQLGRPVSESAFERKDPGSNPAADMVDAARNTAWDMGNVDCDSWIVDSGATQHMCNKKNQLLSYSDLSSPLRIEIGDGRALKGVGVGDVRLKKTLPNMQVAFCTKEIDIVCCPSNDMLADIFTKGLSAEKFSRLRRKLGVVFFEKHIQCEKEC